MPSLESPWIPTCPLPCSLSKKVNSSKPVAVGVVSIKHLESVHDQIVLILTGRLGQEPIVLDTALHGLERLVRRKIRRVRQWTCWRNSSSYGRRR